MSCPLGAWPLNEPLPAVLRDLDLMRVLNLAKSSFYAQKRKGKFRCLEVKRDVTGGTRYSGRLVQRLVEGDTLAAFGKGSRAPRQEGASA